MARKPCLTCGDPSDQPRCPRHTRVKRNYSAPYDAQHLKLKKRAVAAWVRIHGWTCPGWKRPAHPIFENGLEGEHIIPRSLRPDLAYEPSNYGVLCRSCNARKGNRLK